MKIFYKEHVFGYIMTGIISDKQDKFFGFSKVDKTCKTCYFNFEHATHEVGPCEYCVDDNQWTSKNK